MKTFILILVACLALSGCETTPPCDEAKVITDWEPWKAEVCRIQCVQVKICGDDPDEGLINPGYGYALSLWLKNYTPCRAAEEIIARRKSQPK